MTCDVALKTLVLLCLTVLTAKHTHGKNFLISYEFKNTKIQINKTVKLFKTILHTMCTNSSIIRCK